MCLGAVEQVGPTTQLFLKYGPECGFWTQHLETVDTGVDTALSERERGVESGSGLIGWRGGVSRKGVWPVNREEGKM